MQKLLGAGPKALPVVPLMRTTGGWVAPDGQTYSRKKAINATPMDDAEYQDVIKPKFILTYAIFQDFPDFAREWVKAGGAMEPPRHSGTQTGRWSNAQTHTSSQGRHYYGVGIDAERIAEWRRQYEAGHGYTDAPHYEHPGQQRQPDPEVLERWRDFENREYRGPKGQEQKQHFTVNMDDMIKDDIYTQNNPGAKEKLSEWYKTIFGHDPFDI